MNIGRKLKMFYYAGILFLMSMLAVGTVMAMEDVNNNSYLLEIRKVISVDQDMTQAEIQELLNEVYEFRVEANYEKAQTMQNVQTVTIGGPGYEWEQQEDGSYIGKEEVIYKNAVTVTAIELTDHVESTGGWDMTATQCESRMHVPGMPEKPGWPAVAEFDISKDNGRIDIMKMSGDAEKYYYKVTGPGSKGSDGLEDSDESVIPGSWTGSTVIEIKRNSRKRLTGLMPGHYIVEELKAPEGFEILAEWEVQVEAQTTGTVHINGKSGKMTITAPDGEDDHSHCYKIQGPNWNKTIELAHEEIYTLENLYQGDYKVTEYINFQKSGFRVDTPKTTISTFSAVKYNFKTNTKFKYTINGNDQNGDYVRAKISNIEGPAADSKLTYRIWGTWYGEEEAGEKARNFDIPSYNSNSVYTTPASRRLHPGVIWFMFSNDSNVTSCDLQWILYKRETAESESQGEVKTVEVDDRGWMEITKLKNASRGTEQISYIFTVTDSKGNVAATVDLKAGETKKIEGLDAGTYTVSEEIDELSVALRPFTLSVSDSQSTTKPEGEFMVNMLSEGSIKIQKSGNTVEHGERGYSFRITGLNGYEEIVTLQAGTEKMLGETKRLPAGVYTIRATDDVNTGYDLLYSDGSTVKVLKANGLFSWVQFTNVYTRESGSYHVIHEYYLKEGDQYTWEGSSTISAVHGVPLNGSFYTAENVTRLPVHEGREYQYEQAAYGNVAALATADYNSAPGNMINEMENGSHPTEGILPEDMSSPVEEKLPEDISSPAEEKLPEDMSSPAEEKLPEDMSSSAEEKLPEDMGSLAEEKLPEDMGSLAGESLLEDMNSPVEEVLSEGMGSPAEEDVEEWSDIRSSENEEKSDVSSAKIENVPDEEMHKQDGNTSNEDVLKEGETDGSNPMDEIPGDSTPDEEIVKDDGNLSENTMLQEEEVPGKAYDDHGIISSGIGEKLTGEEYQYSPEAGKNSVIATENGEQIIILRYVRSVEEPIPTTGTYKVVHEYYKRDAEGEHFEGRSEIRNVEGELPLNSEMHYTAHSVDRENRFSPDGGATTYTYIDNGFGYGLLEGNAFSGGEIEKERNYRPDSSMHYVFATESGEQIIILRYYREEEVPVFPTVPREPEEPEKEEDNEGNIIQISGADTGDPVTIVPWVILAVVSLGCTIVLCLFSAVEKEPPVFSVRIHNSSVPWLDCYQDSAGTKERLDL